MSQDFRDDTASSVGPENWYYACDHWPNICQYVHAWKGCSDLHCVDLFSVSQQITKAFRRQCYRSVSWDIKLDPTHDISTESGWYGVLELCLRLFLGFGTVYCSLVYLIGNSWIVLVSMLFRIILHSWASLQHILLTSVNLFKTHQGCSRHGRDASTVQCVFQLQSFESGAFPCPSPMNPNKLILEYFKCI